MANTSGPFGMKPVRYLNGAMWNGQVSRYLIPAADANAMFIGDPVALAGSSGAQGSRAQGIPTDGMPTIALAAITSAFLGAIVGFEINPADLELRHRLASTLRVALVSDDPNLIYEMQEDSVGGNIAAASVGLNVEFIAGTGSTTTALSGYMVDSSTVAAGATLGLKLLRLVIREDNEGPAFNFARWEVMVNSHHFRAGVAGV